MKSASSYAEKYLQKAPGLLRKLRIGTSRLLQETSAAAINMWNWIGGGGAVSKLPANAGFIWDKASATAAVLREKVEDTLCNT